MIRRIDRGTARDKGIEARFGRAFQSSAAFRASAVALSGLLLYLLVRRIVDPGFTNYWWFLLAQIGATLMVVIALEAMRAGGLAKPTHVIVVIATFVGILGTAGHLYDAFGPYDKLVHFWNGAAITAIAYELVGVLRWRGVVNVGRPGQAALAVGASLLLLGLAWETYEYVRDVVVGSGRVYERRDTVYDLVADCLGAGLAIAALHCAPTRGRDLRPVRPALPRQLAVSLPPGRIPRPRRAVAAEDSARSKPGR